MFNKKAQTTLEYSILIALVVAALIAMQVYVKRGIQGRLRSATDEIGEQFSPGYTTYSYTTTTTTTSTERIEGGERPITTTQTTQTQDRTGYETTPEFEKEYWPTK